MADGALVSASGPVVPDYYGRGTVLGDDDLTSALGTTTRSACSRAASTAATAERAKQHVCGVTAAAAAASSANRCRFGWLVLYISHAAAHALSNAGAVVILATGAAFDDQEHSQ